MTSYLVTYHGGGMPESEEGRQQAMAAFGAAMTVSADGEHPGAADGPVAGYSVLRADDMESAVSLVRDHPFVGRGGSLTVMEAVAPLDPPARRRPGPLQARSPSMARPAGSRTPRTMVASMSTATAMATPNILNSISDSVAKIENTATMIAAALVTTPALLAIPPVIAFGADAPPSRSSLIRLRMNTW